MSFQILKEKLKQGFYVDNLNEMALLCKDMALESSNPAPLFIMQKIFTGIADYWDDRPVVVEEAKVVEGELTSILARLIAAIEVNNTAEEIMLHVNKAVSSYLFLFK